MPDHPNRTMTFKLPRLRCQRCEHEWVPRTLTVRECPSCKSAYWDTPRKAKPVLTPAPELVPKVEMEEPIHAANDLPWEDGE